MDPLSIVASSVGLLMACGKATFVLHNFISSTKEVHSTITTLHADITSLAELLEDLKVLFGKREIGDVIDAGMDNFNGRVWRRAHGILESVSTTVAAIETLITRVEGKKEKGKEKERVEGGTKMGVMKRGWMQLKIEFRAGDFELRHHQIQTQRSTLQIFLASITLCLQVHAESEQATATEKILASIHTLKQDVKNLDPVGIRKKLEDSTTMKNTQEPASVNGGYYASTRPFEDADTLSDPLEDLPQENSSFMEQTTAESKVMVDNLEETLESAKEVIHSAQASIASRRDGSVQSNHSVTVSDQGSVFNLASHHRINDWMTGNVITEESDSDTESEVGEMDLEGVISKRLQQQGDQHLELRTFEEAEDFFNLSLRHYEMTNTQTEERQTQLKLKLAIARARQQKWEDVEELLNHHAPSTIVKTEDLDFLTAWHLLAEFKLKVGSLEYADDICRKVTRRRRTLLRKRDPSQEESLQLLIQITQAKSVQLKANVAELLLHGIDVNKAPFDGNSELRNAVRLGHLHLINLLLTLPKVDINSTGTEGLSAIAYAWLHSRGEVYSLLAKRGADLLFFEDDILLEWKKYFEHIPVAFFEGYEHSFRMEAFSEKFSLTKPNEVDGRYTFEIVERVLQDVSQSMQRLDYKLEKLKGRAAIDAVKGLYLRICSRAENPGFPDANGLRTLHAQIIEINLNLYEALSSCSRDFNTTRSSVRNDLSTLSKKKALEYPAFSATNRFAFGIHGLLQLMKDDLHHFSADPPKIDKVREGIEILRNMVIITVPDELNFLHGRIVDFVEMSCLADEMVYEDMTHLIKLFANVLEICQDTKTSVMELRKDRTAWNAKTWALWVDKVKEEVMLEVLKSYKHFAEVTGPSQERLTRLEKQIGSPLESLR